MANVARGLIVIGIGVLVVLMFALPSGVGPVGSGFLTIEVGGIILYAGLAILVFDITQHSAQPKKTSTSQRSLSILCRNCGKDLKALPQDAKFCYYCGSSTVSDEETKIY
jgi:hypothetical protein